jgi:hypothetical protein
MGAYPVLFGPGTPGVVASKAGVADAAAKPGVSHIAENASSLATTAGSKTGANTCVCAGVGQRLVTFTATTATGGKTITHNGNHDCAAITPVVFTEGVTFTCPNGATVASCALSYVAALNGASKPTGVESASCTTAGGAGWTDGIVAIKLLPDTCDFAVTDNAAGEITQTESADGAMVAPAGTSAIPGVTIGSGTGNGFSSDGTYTYFIRGGSTKAYLTDSTIGISGYSTSISNTAVQSAGYLLAVTYVRSTTSALGTCAAAGDAGKWQTMTKTDYTYPCFCEKTGAATYAWTPVTATGTAQGCN